MSILGKITNRGLELNKDDLVSVYGTNGFKKILRKFIIRYKSPIGTYYIEKKNYTIINNIVLIPRFATEKLLECKIINSIENHIKEGLDIHCEYIGEPTYNQEITANYILNNIYTNENKSKGIAGLTLNLLAGGGKSYLAMFLINKLKKKTLIIVPNEYLLKQWVDLLSRFFPTSKIGQYYGKVKEEGDIIVGIINSLVSDEFTFKWYEYEFTIDKKGKEKRIKKKYEKTISSKDFHSEFDFIILDESHIYCTESFKKIYNVFQSTYMLGLSATPNERDNGLDIISHLNIGNVLNAETIEGYNKDTTVFNARVDIIKYNGPNEYIINHINEKTKMICVPMIIEDLINDPYRNKLILNTIYELFDLKLNIFIFSERRSHLEHLYEQFNEILEEQNLENYRNNISVPELDINTNIVLYGNSPNEDIETAKLRSNLIFTTYAYSSTGVSINRMTAMILCTPRKSKATQIIGRIFRLNEENIDEERIIIDIVDNRSVLKNQLYKRMKAYKEREAIITKKEINYTDIEL